MSGCDACLEALEKVVIFVDEADTQFGTVAAGGHETERRLTGKIQAMMSDTRLRGQVIWLLMTARIHLLSPDIRRPGRVGDLIIPILDPRGDDRRDFIRWVLQATSCLAMTTWLICWIVKCWRQEYSAAAFASLRSQLKAESPTQRRRTDRDHSGSPAAGDPADTPISDTAGAGQLHAT